MLKHAVVSKGVTHYSDTFIFTIIPQAIISQKVATLRIFFLKHSSLHDRSHTYK